MRRLVATHLDVGPVVTIAQSSSGHLERGLLLPQGLVQVDNVGLHAGDLIDGLEMKEG